MLKNGSDNMNTILNLILPTGGLLVDMSFDELMKLKKRGYFHIPESKIINVEKGVYPIIHVPDNVIIYELDKKEYEKQEKLRELEELQFQQKLEQQKQQQELERKVREENGNE